MTEFGWYLKQLLPLTYVSKYQLHGKPCLSIWKMWFGKVFNHRIYWLEK